MPSSKMSTQAKQVGEGGDIIFNVMSKKKSLMRSIAKTPFIKFLLIKKV